MIEYNRQEILDKTMTKRAETDRNDIISRYSHVEALTEK